MCTHMTTINVIISTPVAVVLPHSDKPYSKLTQCTEIGTAKHDNLVTTLLHGYCYFSMGSHKCSGRCSNSVHHFLHTELCNSWCSYHYTSQMLVHPQLQYLQIEHYHCLEQLSRYISSHLVSMEGRQSYHLWT